MEFGNVVVGDAVGDNGPSKECQDPQKDTDLLVLVLVARTDSLVRCHHFHAGYGRHTIDPQHRRYLSLEHQGDVGGRLRDDVRDGDGVARVREALRRRQHKVRLKSSDVIARQAPAGARQGDVGFTGLHTSAMKGPHVAPIHAAGAKIVLLAHLVPPLLRAAHRQAYLQ